MGNWLDDRIMAIRDMRTRIGKGRWAVVGVDGFNDGPDDAGDDLFLVEVYQSQAEAEAALAARKAAKASASDTICDTYYVYEGL